MRTSRLLVAVVLAGSVVLALPSLAAAANMDVSITITGRGWVSGPDFHCANDSPDPAQSVTCRKTYTAPDPFGVPEAGFVASVGAVGWAFPGWGEAHFTTCNVVAGSVCVIRGRQNASVNRDVQASFTRATAPPPAIHNPTATDTAASFDVSVGERVNSVECVLVTRPAGVPFASGCPDGAELGDSVWRPASFGSLPGGAYRFIFRVTDFFNNVSETHHDVEVVQTSITAAPPGFSANTAPRFEFGTAGGNAYRCSIDGVLGWQSCGSPFTTPPLRPDGLYTMRVAAQNGGFVDPNPAVNSWVVDTTAPRAAIAQPVEGARLGTPTATIVFSGSDQLSNPLRFQCRLDGAVAGFSACTSPKVIPHIAPGAHVLDLRAIDRAGNASAVVRRRFVVEQPDADRDSFRADVDCNDANPRINPKAVEILDNDVDENCDRVKGIDLDRDADGFNRPDDCDDSDAAVRPGASDRPANGIDEDCSGRDADWPRIVAPITSTWHVQGRRTRVVALHAKELPRGAAVRVRCRGRGCAFRSLRPRVRGGKADALKAFRRRALVAGTTVEVRITLPGTIGKVMRYTMRAGKLPRKTPLCVMPSRNSATACP